MHIYVYIHICVYIYMNIYICIYIYARYIYTCVFTMITYISNIIWTLSGGNMVPDTNIYIYVYMKYGTRHNTYIYVYINKFKQLSR